MKIKKPKVMYTMASIVHHEFQTADDHRAWSVWNCSMLVTKLLTSMMLFVTMLTTDLLPAFRNSGSAAQAVW